MSVDYLQLIALRLFAIFKTILITIFQSNLLQECTRFEMLYKKALGMNARFNNTDVQQTYVSCSISFLFKTNATQWPRGCILKPESRREVTSHTIGFFLQMYYSSARPVVVLTFGVLRNECYYSVERHKLGLPFHDIHITRVAITI